MNQIGLFSFLKKKLQAICLTDRCLLLFMIILLTQTAYSLFISEASTAENSAIDVVIRTTSAAIFGYFISGGFLRGSASPENKNPLPPLSASSGPTTNTAFPDFEHRSHQQIIIVTCIGGLSLVFLILAQDMGDITASTIAIASQLRDFVSGSVGLLIGHSTRDKT